MARSARGHARAYTHRRGSGNMAGAAARAGNPAAVLGQAEVGDRARRWTMCHARFLKRPKTQTRMLPPPNQLFYTKKGT